MRCPSSPRLASRVRSASGAFAAALVALLAAPPVSSMHEEGCIPDQEPTIAEVEPLPGRRFYVALDPGPHVWLYEETNGLPGLQRGGIGFFGACFPPAPLQCLYFDEDPRNTENCGHGRDRIIL